MKLRDVLSYAEMRMLVQLKWDIASGKAKRDMEALYHILVPADKRS